MADGHPIPSDPRRVPTHTIRPLDPASDKEIEWVARGMRRTLIEVEGEATGTALYTMEWLRQRVRWHLDPAKCRAQVLVAQGLAAQGERGELAGYTLVREEIDEHGRRFGLFSTTFVEPACRRAGLAARLLQAGEQWMIAQALPESATWTSASNAKLIGLYRRHGYAQVATHVHEVTATRMVRLARPLR
jgi:GNAT superfamily N-acetyltransferase